MASRPMVFNGCYSHNGLEIAQDHRAGKTTALWEAVTNLCLAKTSALKVSVKGAKGLPFQTSW